MSQKMDEIMAAALAAVKKSAFYGYYVWNPKNKIPSFSSAVNNAKSIDEVKNIIATWAANDGDVSLSDSAIIGNVNSAITKANGQIANERTTEALANGGLGVSSIGLKHDVLVSDSVLNANPSNGVTAISSRKHVPSSSAPPSNSTPQPSQYTFGVTQDKKSIIVDKDGKYLELVPVPPPGGKSDSFAKALYRMKRDK